MADDVERFIMQHQYNQPQMKPDEHREFLGNYRDRVGLALTVAQLRESATIKLLVTVLKRYPTYHVYINGRMSKGLVSKVMLLANDQNSRFTVFTQQGVRQKKDLKASEYGVVLAAEQGEQRPPILF